MEGIGDFFRRMFDTSDWPARWHCGTWTDFHGWLYIISDLSVWGAYFAIPAIILYFRKHRPNVSFSSIFWLFGAFILACGASHLVDALMFYWPAYRVNALIRLFTAVISWITVFALFRILPKALQMKTAAEFQTELDERRKVQEELASKNEALEEASLELSSQNAQLKDFAYITSHNLRSPVANLHTLLQLREESQSEEENQVLLEKFKVTVTRLSDTLNQLIDVTRVRSGYFTQVEEISFDSSLRKVKDSLAAQLLKTGARLEADFSAADRVIFSPLYMESILLNLVSNALKYRSPERTPFIRLKSKNSPDGVELRVSDNGLGIDLDRHGDKIFGMLKTFHDHDEARGMGLFMTKTQMESLGGKISVTSAVNQGTEFTLVFKRPQ